MAYTVGDLQAVSNKIKDLTYTKWQYGQTINGIGSVIEYLNTAKGYIVSAGEGLSQYYTGSAVGSAEAEIILGYNTSIEGVIDKLNGIIGSCNERISMIEKSIDFLKVEEQNIYNSLNEP